MRAGTIKISDELLCESLGFDKQTVILGIKRGYDYASTEIVVVHPKLPNLIQGAIPPPIQIEKLRGVK